MPYGCNMNGVPRIRTYAEALAYYRRIDKWFDDGDGKPIKNNLRRDNMRMRMVDERVVLRFYETDCVTYHPSGQVTVQGFETMSTNAFVDLLTPDGIEHAMGRKGYGEPVLYLRAQDGARWSPDVKIVRCESPVTLDYCARERRWMPCGEVEPFTFTTVDHAKARSVMRRYRLTAFLQAVPAIDALIGESRWDDASEALDALLAGDFVAALRHCPRGEGGTYGKPNSSMPGAVVCTRFLAELRREIYREADALTTAKKPVITPSEYHRWKAEQRLFC